MDRLFQAPTSRGRLNRRQIQNRDDQSPESKPPQTTYQSNPETKPADAPRYGAQRRLEAQKKRQQQQALNRKQEPLTNPRGTTNKNMSNIKTEDSKHKQNSTIDSKVQIEDKNTGSRYSLISRQDILAEKQKTEELSSSRKGPKRYGTNRNNEDEQQLTQVKTDQNPSENKRRLQRKSANQRTRQEPSKQQIEKQQNQQYAPVLGKYGGSKRTPIPAEKLTNEKLEEVQSIVKRPLNRKSQDKQFEEPKRQQGLQTTTALKKQPLKQHTSQADKKKLVPNTLMDDIIKPIERKDRYGARRRESQIKSKQVLTDQHQEGLRKTEQLKKQPERVQTSQGNQKRVVPNTLIDDIIKPIERKDRYGARRRESQIKSNQVPSNQNKETLPNSRKNIMTNSQNEISIESKTQSKQQISKKQQSQAPAFHPRRSRPTESQIIPQKSTNSMLQNNQKLKMGRSAQNRTASRVSTSIQSQPLQKQQQTQPAQINKVSQKPIKEGTPHQSKRASRVSIDTEPQQKQGYPKQRKKSNVIAFTLCRIVKLKMRANFQILQATTKAHDNKWKVKLLVQTLSCIAAYKKYENLRHVIMFLSNESSMAKIDHRQIPNKYEVINKKCREFLPKIIDNLFQSRQRLVLNTFQKNIKRQQNPLWMIGLSKLGQRPIKNTFESIKVFTVKRAVIKSAKANQIAQIIKLKVKNNYSFAYLKLRAAYSSTSVQVQENKVQKLSRTVTPQTSPIRQNILVSQEFNKLQKICERQKQQWSEQQENQQQNLDILKSSCSNEKQSIEQKKRKLEIIKQKMEEIHKPEKEGIQQDQISLQETRYPLLQEIYLKVFRNQNYVIYSSNQLSKSYPFLAQDTLKDVTTQKWQVLMENKALKSQIEKYEGVAALERKTSEILTEQANMITNLAKNYIQEKYMWGQVKKAVTRLLTS